jgi:hypothetical protein
LERKAKEKGEEEEEEEDRWDPQGYNGHFT